MSHLDKNPFIQDVERQQSERSPRFLIRFGSKVYTAIVWIVVIVAFAYVIVSVLSLIGNRSKESYDPRLPVQLWPGNIDPPSNDEQVPYHVDRPVRQWPTTEASSTETGIMENGLLGTINWTTPIWTATIKTTSNWTESMPELTSQFSITVQAVEPTIDKLDSQEIPSASQCVSSKLTQEAFHEKQWICHQCWTGNYSTLFKTEEIHSHFCYNNCFENDIFKQCAITLEMILLLQAA